ncbi:MAG: ECF transporter S component [Lachnospiraceae bacterium]|nr:ECF transporter S component [Lachnospiraceae bacterium]
MRNSKVTKMVQMAILIAIILLMAFTPIGYIRTGALSITFIMIPVVIGAMILGPAAGALLGTVFGLTSFAQCFMGDVFGATLVNINPIFTFITCVLARTLTGYLTGVLFNLIKKADKTKTVCYFAGGLIGAVLNTVFFMGALMAFFWNTDLIQGINESTGGKGVLAVVVAMVTINGVLEWFSTCALGGIVSKAVNKIVKSNEV